MASHIPVGRAVWRGKYDRGFALITTIVMIVTFAGLSLTYFLTSSTSVRHAERRESSMRMEVAATGAAQLVAQDLWNRYLVWNGGKAGKLDNFRKFLDTAAPIAIGPGGNATFGAPADAITLVASDPQAPRFGDLDLTAASLRRRDTEVSTDIEVTVAVATSTLANGRAETIRQVFSVGGEVFKGFEYSLLTNNVNCIMCHATFDTADRFYNTDATALGSFDRVKVGTLESMQIRPDSAESEVYGTLHSRGLLMDEHGELLGSLSGSTLTGAEMDGTGKIQEDTDGSIYEDDLELASGSPLPKFGQLYLDYPTDPAQMTDGILPTSFPSAIPDLDNDKQVDPEEVALIADEAHGTLSGGDIVMVPPGGTFTGATGNTSNQIDGTTNNHLILVGTEDKPIQIDGRVVIDGDVALFGVVKGDGVIYATGNVYVLGDITYADGVDASGYRTYGVGEDGTPNSLALAAGGNVLAGDYLSIPTFGVYKNDPQPVNGDGTGSYNFTMNEIAIFNRGEWAKTQETLPGKDGTPVTNPGYEPGYLPRYYVLNEGDPVFIFNGENLSAAQQYKLYYDPSGNVWKGEEALFTYDSKYLKRIDAGDPEYQTAATKALNPQGDWLSTDMMKALRQYAGLYHETGTPQEVDALLYTNNATFTMVRNQSKYAGKMLLNGGLISADTGVLVPSGLRVNHDSRASKHVNLADLTKAVEMRRAVWTRVSNYSAAP